MIQSAFKKNKKRIRILFKELIKRYKSQGYKSNIVHVKNRGKYPTFQLRFIKQGSSCIYYRVVLRENESQ